MASCSASGMATSRISTERTCTPQALVFSPMVVLNRASAVWRSDSRAESMDEPIISRSEVWATRSMAMR